MIRDPGLIDNRHIFQRSGRFSTIPARQPRARYLTKTFRRVLSLAAQLCPPDCEIRWQSFYHLIGPRNETLGLRVGQNAQPTAPIDSLQGHRISSPAKVDVKYLTQ